MRIKGIIVLALLLLGATVWASERPGDTIRPPRPKVGIVLGGGGAKGAAHIGALKYIEEIGLPVDYVAGTSMGSIIGGLYALGYSPDEIEQFISQLDWSKYMTNSIDRLDISSADKQRRSTYLANIPFNHGQLFDRIRQIRMEDEANNGPSFIASLPDSFIGGTDLLNLFNSLCIGYQDPMDFNDFPIPFACVATNLTTGDPVVLRSGKFPEAIRASMAIPGVFSPMVIDGKVLVDGGLVNNFPADICREMGADIIIGIEVAQGMIKDASKLKSLPQLFSQMKNIVVKGHNEENRQLCDLYIHPEVNDFNMLSFSTQAIDTIVNRGYACAAKYQKELLTLKRYIDSFEPAEKILQNAKAQYVTDDTIQLEAITMDNVSPKEFKWLFRKSKLHLNQDITDNDIQRAINIFKGTGVFSGIEYRLSPSQDGHMTAKPKDFDLHLNFHPSEPHCLSLGFNYNSEESAALILNLGIGQNKFSGLKFNLTSRLGLHTKVNSTVTWAGLSLANFNLSYDFSRAKYSVLSNNKSEALILHQHRFRFFISEFHLRNIQTSVGIESERSSYPISPLLGNEPHADKAQLRSSIWGPFAKLKFDNMNDAYFASTGILAEMDVHERIIRGAEAPFTDLGLAFKYHYTVGKFTFVPQVYTRFLMGDSIPYTYNNIIGGEVYGRYHDFQLPFVGINNTTLAKNQCAILRLDVRYRLLKKHYITASGNFVRSADNFGTLFSFDDEGISNYGCGVKYSYDSHLGPISFGLNYSNITRDFCSYFSLGYVF